MDKPKSKRACVVVLGDFGRSPRMQYHVLSLCKQKYLVDVVAYHGSKPIPELFSMENLTMYLYKEPPNFGKHLPKSFALFFKVIWQLISLFCTLIWLETPHVILVQNPPSIPTLPVIWFYSRLMSVPVIVDWHNYGFTILSINLKSAKHLLVRIYEWGECFFGRRAKEHFCVSEAFKSDLDKRLGVNPFVLFDKPPSHFHTVSVSERKDLLKTLSQKYSTFFNEKGKSVFTESSRFIISSTSWTEDEDFNILFEALRIYNLKVNENKKLPPIICVVTGRGPQKEHYLKLIKELNMEHVKIICPWLEIEDYPKLLACSDFGVCLHMSSSKVDLPMKVVDMFGCGVPVCAYWYNAIDELVLDSVNGFTFKDAQQLGDQIQKLIEQPDLLSTFKKNLEDFNKLSWDDHWEEVALPVFKKYLDIQLASPN